jgi:hypothetical protein
MFIGEQDPHHSTHTGGRQAYAAACSFAVEQVVVLGAPSSDLHFGAAVWFWTHPKCTMLVHVAEATCFGGGGTIGYVASFESGSTVLVQSPACLCCGGATRMHAHSLGTPTVLAAESAFLAQRVPRVHPSIPHILLFGPAGFFCTAASPPSPSSSAPTSFPLSPSSGTSRCSSLVTTVLTVPSFSYTPLYSPVRWHFTTSAACNSSSQQLHPAGHLALQLQGGCSKFVHLLVRISHTNGAEGEKTPWCRTRALYDSSAWHRYPCRVEPKEVPH